MGLTSKRTRMDPPIQIHVQNLQKTVSPLLVPIPAY